jgi:hypothetical protein
MQERLRVLYEKIDSKMLNEIHELVDGAGGEVKQIDLNKKVINLTVDQEIEDEIHEKINDMIKYYSEKKRSLFVEHPFLMAQIIQDELGIEEI